MTLDAQPIMKVIGVGGGGSTAINRMVEAGLEGVEFGSVDTNKDALARSSAGTKIQLGGSTASGLGSEGNAEVGRSSAEESRSEISEVVGKSDLIFMIAGMGRGTGTGAAPVIAEIAKVSGALTVAIVTKPFGFEGTQRRVNAEKGLTKLSKCVHCLIVVSNNKLLTLKLGYPPIRKAFRKADDVLWQAVQGISDMIARPVEDDWKDIKSMLQDAGATFLGIGNGRGERRVAEALAQAISSALTEQSISRARKLLVNITAGDDLDLDEAEEIVTSVRAAAGVEEHDTLWSLVFDPTMSNELRLTVYGTGQD